MRIQGDRPISPAGSTIAKVRQAQISAMGEQTLSQSAELPSDPTHQIELAAAPTHASMTSGAKPPDD